MQYYYILNKNLYDYSTKNAGERIHRHFPITQLYFLTLLFFATAYTKGLYLFEKIITLIIYKNKRRKSSTSIFQIASIPSSGYSRHSTFLILFCASMAAGPPILPR